MNSGAGKPCQNGREPGKRRSANSPRWAFWRGAPALGVLAAVLFVSGCGGGPGAAGAAGGTTSTTLSRNCAGTCRLARMIDYARCMRSHGLPTFADPVPVTSPSGKPGWRIGYSGDPNSLSFTTADGACKHYLPDAFSTNVPLTAEQQQAWLEWASCIRSHGFATFPDPAFSGSGVRVPSLSGADPTDPAKAVAAQHACAHYLSST